MIKGLLDRFGRVQMSAARLVTGARNYDLIPLVLHVLAAGGVFKEGYIQKYHAAQLKVFHLRAYD